MPETRDGGWILDDSEVARSHYGAENDGKMKAAGCQGGDLDWTAEQIAALPDSSFAYVEPGGVVKHGRTQPVALRHFPYKDAEGGIEPPLLAASLAGIDNADLPRTALARTKALLTGMSDGIAFAMKRSLIEKYITNKGGKWQVRAESGKVLGEHGSKADAVRQLAAVEANKPKEKAAPGIDEINGLTPGENSFKRSPGSEVQALVFSEEQFKTAKDAGDWANDHGYKSSPVSPAEGGFRIEQAAAEKFADRETVELTAGVSAVVGVPREAVKALRDAFKSFCEVRKIVVKAADVRVEGVDESSFGAVWRIGYGNALAYFVQKGSVAIHLPSYVPLSKDGFVPVMKAEEQKYTLGVVYPAKEIDFHGDTMTPEELEKTAWAFMGKDGAAGRVGLMHRPGTAGAGRVVESYIYRGPKWMQKAADGRSSEQVVEPGDWLMGVVWDSEGWDAVKSGKITGYSLQGVARKEATF